MARLDVYRLPGSRAVVVDVQSAFLDHLAVRVVVPLLPPDKTATPVAQLNPVFDIEGQRLALFTQLIAAVPKRDLTRPIASLTAHHDEITRALDILLTGF